MTNVISLRQYDTASIINVRQWLLDQANAPIANVAGCSVTVTTDGKVRTQGCGIEPAHAAVMLEPLKALVARLEVYVADTEPDLLVRAGVHKDLPSNVVPLWR